MVLQVAAFNDIGDLNVCFAITNKDRKPQIFPSLNHTFNEFIYGPT
jgi:hypothetical protein